MNYYDFTTTGLLGMEPLNKEEMSLMEASCGLAAEALLLAGEQIRPGVTTGEINQTIHDFITSRNAYPSPLHYHGFPRSICTSRNEVVCHGIPSNKETLRNGDIINVDVSTYFPLTNGFHGDTSATFYVGEPTDEARLVVETARECLYRGIQTVKPGARVGDIGFAIQSYAEERGCSVVRGFVGHGVGRVFHGEPSIPNWGKKGTGVCLSEGMIFTIEPMINLGSPEYEFQSNNWTVLTKDRNLSAQFEHTVLVTPDGVKILTKRSKSLKNSEESLKKTTNK